MKNLIKSLLLGFALSTLSGLVAADEPAPPPAPPETLLEAVTGGKPLTSFRFRYESVEQDGNGAAPYTAVPLKDAHAATLRSLIGWQTAPFRNISVGIQIINVAKIDDNFNDRSHALNTAGKEGYAIVADPDFTGLNQFYVDWTGIPDTKVRAGLQSVKLDNVRFIGNVEFRQVMQVFEGVAIENKTIPNTEIYVAYFAKNRNINTDDKPDNTGILHAMYRISPSESLIGYGYLFDQQQIAVASNTSSKTFGLRLDGAHKVNDDWKVLYTAEYAKQDDYGDSRGRTDAQGQVDAHYYKIGAGAGYGNWWARLDQELLSSNNGRYAFQTPLGTNHLFQGWVDKFLTTPNEGIRDTFITAGGKWQDFTFLTEYHWFNSDVDFTKTAATGGGLSDKYGKEWDVSVTYTYNKNIMGKIEYGTYTEDDQRNAGRIRDTDKLWLTAMYTF